MAEEQKESIREGLMAHRTVVLVEEVSDKTVWEIINKMFNLQMKSSDPINLIIDSPGGSLTAAFQLCDFIENLFTAPVRGITIGLCASAATLIMLSCNKRLGTRNSKFVIHSSMRSGIGLQNNHTSVENLELLLKDLRTTEEKYIKHYLNHLTPIAWKDGKPSENEQREFVRSLLRRGDQNFDQRMTAEEAVESGLIEEIVEGKLDIFPTNK